MRKLICTSIITLVFACTISAQSEQKPKAYVFAEFTTATDSNIAFIMKPFYSVLRNENAQGYIIVYGSPRGIKNRRAAIMKGMTWRVYDPSRITFVDGPAEKLTRTEMWIVPTGAENPAPRTRK